MAQERQIGQSIAAEAAEWLEKLERRRDDSDCAGFIRWASQDAERVKQVLELHALLVEAKQAVRANPRRATRLDHSRKIVDLPARRNRKKSG